jgi:hypothetical protein
MASQAFVDSVIKEIIQPGVDQRMILPYFTELRSRQVAGTAVTMSAPAIYPE